MTTKRRGYFVYDLPDQGLALNDLVVFEPPDITVDFGLVDQYGNPISRYEIAGMNPIGFIHFDRDNASDSDA